MEELKTAIGAMKQAEEALAKRGFTLRWNVRVKANRKFFRTMSNNILSEAMKVEPSKTAPENKQAAPVRPAKEKGRKAVPEPAQEKPTEQAKRRKMIKGQRSRKRSRWIHWTYIMPLLILG